MILLLLAILFCWLIFREFTNKHSRFDGLSLAYVSVLALLVVACVRPVYKTWRLEVLLSEKASFIAGRSNVKVRCNSLFDTLFSGKGVSSPAGTAYMETGEIFFESGWCKTFMAYLDDPEGASSEEIFAMHLFTHEVMHIRGESNENRADCQAIQRNHFVGDLFGIDQQTARRNAKTYYYDYYPRHPYFDKNCRPGGKLDEGLTGSIWDGGRD